MSTKFTTYIISTSAHSISLFFTFNMRNKKKGVFFYATSTFSTTTNFSKPKKNQLGTDHQERKNMILRTATTRISYFSRKGNQPRRENVFTKHYTNRAIKYKEEKKLTPQASFPVFFYAATPFIRLKTRRRGGRRTRLKQKITFRPRHVGERQGFLLFVKHFRKNIKAAKSGSFRGKFQTQRESITQSRKANAASKLKSNLRKSMTPISFGFHANTYTNLRAIKSRVRTSLFATSTGSSSTKSLRELRDDIHKRAFVFSPNKWGRNRWKKKRSFFRSGFGVRYASSINGDFF